MTDSMNFGPDWIRNLSSEGSTGGGSAGSVKYQLADHRYGREEMLALFDKNSKPPASLTNFKCLYSEQTLVPLALLPTTEEERGWQGRPTTLAGGPSRGRGGSLERGGRISRGRGYQYGRMSSYDVDQSEWSPRKEYNTRTASLENWRKSKIGDSEDDGWRGVPLNRNNYDKWGRLNSWRGEGDLDEKGGLQDRIRSAWGETGRAPPGRKSWDNEDHLPEWANENPLDGGGSFDDKGAFHGSDDEQFDPKPMKRELGLQKSTSQQLISSKTHIPPPLSTSKSSVSLIKHEESAKKSEDQPAEPGDTEPDKEPDPTPSNFERMKSIPNVPTRMEKPPMLERTKSEDQTKLYEKQITVPNGPDSKNDEPDFERLQEDFVLKLMGDEELPKANNKFEMGGIQPPPNLIPPTVQDKWFYQDPQGQMQGPFSNIEMAEWYKAGYFNNQLKVRRQCDERFFLLGELIGICGDANPFTSSVRFPVLKNDVTKMPDPDMLQFQYLSQLAAYKQAQARILQEPWNALTIQQSELAANRLMMQQQPVPQELSFMQQSQAANPLMHMISQMQQANKLPNQTIVEKQVPMPPPLDPQFQLHMSNLLSMQNRLPTTGIGNNLPAGLTGNISATLPPENLTPTVPGLPGTLPLSGIPPVSIDGSMNIQRPSSHTTVDQIPPPSDNDPISNLLKQLQQHKKMQQLDSLWQQNQYTMSNPPVPTAQWQSQSEVPMSIWDVSQNNTSIPPMSSNVGSEKPQQQTQGQSHVPAEASSQPQQQQPPQLQPQQQQNQTKQQKVEKEVKQQEEHVTNEKKKKKDQDDKQTKKEAEDKRKPEQKKQDAEKKALEERRKKEEERHKKEMEKTKKELEERRLRELEEKRKMKELKKAAEEVKKKAEEQRKSEERLRREQREIDTRQQELRLSKTAPWSQSNSMLEMSLTEIQRAEKEKRAQEAALQLQRLQEKEHQQQLQQQQAQERVTGLQLNWAKKPVEPRKVKSLAEIQAEEQERLAKQAAESRLQKEKEKEAAPTMNSLNSIWNGQNLPWANPSATNSQWSSNTSGFWEDVSHRHPSNKPSNSTTAKSSAASSFTATTKQNQQQAQKSKSGNKSKKEDTNKNATNHNNNNLAIDEFTNWCYTTLGNMSTDIDIPTFVTFLRDIESAFDVREYCKDYLGDSNATHHFASNFLEKRRLFKPKTNAHKDDLCSPAPAITPSLQHSTEFQEVKGKNKKNKKSKMLKVDSRILGFNVTSAPDRINVGDRDYGDNS